MSRVDICDEKLPNTALPEQTVRDAKPDISSAENEHTG
jgi:hypothetical protein